MGAYDNDPRVVRVSDTEFRIPDSGRQWTVRKEDGGWNAYDQEGTLSRIVSGLNDPDNAIAAIIGDPR